MSAAAVLPVVSISRSQRSINVFQLCDWINKQWPDDELICMMLFGAQGTISVETDVYQFVSLTEAFQLTHRTAAFTSLPEYSVSSSFVCVLIF